jgi:hypothetical protein
MYDCFQLLPCMDLLYKFTEELRTLCETVVVTLRRVLRDALKSSKKGLLVQGLRRLESVLEVCIPYTILHTFVYFIYCI